MPIALTTAQTQPTVANLDWISFTVDRGSPQGVVNISYWEQDATSVNLHSKVVSMTWAAFRTAIAASTATTLDGKVCAALAAALGVTGTIT